MEFEPSSRQAFVPHGRFRVEGRRGGPLSDLTFAVKDLFDVAGRGTSAGNPEWLRSRPAPPAHAALVARLLDAGATLIGKTVCDELAYGLTGRNIHYGTPLNPAAPDRLPGGSSSGSASAVAAGACDFALGTDTGGSVRIPASYCGLFGLRTTHGRLAMDGVVPLAPSFDVVGWFAREALVLRRVGEALFGGGGGVRLSRLLWAEDTSALCDAAVEAAVAPLLGALSDRLGGARAARVCPGDLGAWAGAFRALQGREVWTAHGAWIGARRPAMAPDVAGRFELAARVEDAEVAAAGAVRAEARRRLDELLGEDGVLALPTAPTAAPRLDASLESLQGVRERTLQLTCAAGLAGLPQATIPAGSAGGAPVGLSLIGPRGADEALLELSCALGAAPALGQGSS